MSQLDNGTDTRKARNSRQCPGKETIKKKKKKPSDNKKKKKKKKKQKTEGRAQKKKKKKKKKKNLESTRQGNCHKKS